MLDFNRRRVLRGVCERDGEQRGDDDENEFTDDDEVEKGKKGPVGNVETCSRRTPDCF